MQPQGNASAHDATIKITQNTDSEKGQDKNKKGEKVNGMVKL